MPISIIIKLYYLIPIFLPIKFYIRKELSTLSFNHYKTTQIYHIILHHQLSINHHSRLYILFKNPFLYFIFIIFFRLLAIVL